MRAGASRCFSSRLGSARSCSVIRDESAYPRGGQDSATGVRRAPLRRFTSRGRRSAARKPLRDVEPRSHRVTMYLWTIFFSPPRDRYGDRAQRDLKMREKSTTTDVPLSSPVLLLTGRDVRVTRPRRGYRRLANGPRDRVPTWIKRDRASNRPGDCSWGQSRGCLIAFISKRHAPETLPRISLFTRSQPWVNLNDWIRGK